jgi:hypothetical protein
MYCLGWQIQSVLMCDGTRSKQRNVATGALLGKRWLTPNPSRYALDEQPRTGHYLTNPLIHFSRWVRGLFIRTLPFLSQTVYQEKANLPFRVGGVYPQIFHTPPTPSPPYKSIGFLLLYAHT